MDKISQDWPSLSGFGVEDHGHSIAGEFPIPYKVARGIDSLVQEHRRRRQRPSNYELLFRYFMRKEPTRGQVNRRLVKDFKEMQNWFMKWTHLPAENQTQVDEAELHSRFGAFERMLHSFVGSFFTTTKDLDEILQQANQ